MKNQFRINDDVLLKVNNLVELKDFYGYRTGTYPNIITQYVSYGYQNNPFSELSNLDKTVWFESQKINKVFNSDQIKTDQDWQENASYQAINCTLLLRQGFSWENVFGLLVVIKPMGNALNTSYLLSMIFDINDFSFDYDNTKELISGEFWTKRINFIIPNFDNNMMVSVKTVLFSDVVSNGLDIGKINNYPTNTNQFEPLIGEEPIPDYIQTQVTILPNQYIEIIPVTLELNVTLEQSIINFFQLTDFLIPITVEHIIKYGTDEVGYKTLRISNEDNKYGAVKIGLDLTGFDNNQVSIYVSTEIICNNKLIKRDQQIFFNFNDILNPVINDLILNPENVYPVEFKMINNVENTIIETKTERKIVTVLQPTYIQLVTQTISFENKNISFEDISIKSIMVIKDTEEQFVLSSATVEGKIYFNLNGIKKPSKDNCEYNILDATNNQIIKQGTISI